MGLTTDEERAAKISDALQADLQLGFDRFFSGRTEEWTTPMLYKKKKGGIATSYITVRGDRTRLEVVRSITNPGREPQEFVSVIKDTKKRSAIERALTDVRQRITKKLRDAWCENPDEAETTSAATLVKPMLLHKWEKKKHRINYPAIMSVKADGVRAIYDNGKLYSRSGKIFDLPHITAECKEPGPGGYRLDGEICFEDWTVPLPEVIHAIAHGDPNLKFHIFDIVNANMRYDSRFLVYVASLQEKLTDLPSLRLIKMKVAKSEEEVDAWYERCAQAGMEGIVVRNMDSHYQFGKRVVDVLKYKVEYEDVYPITGYQAVPHNDGDLVMFECRTPNNVIFEVTPAWTHEERREFLRHLDTMAGRQYKTAEILVEYRGLTADNIPYHAVGKTKYKELRGKF